MAYSTVQIDNSQFFRYETYGKAAYAAKQGNKKIKSVKGGKTMYDILGEAVRQDGYTEHIENPKAPILLYGIPFPDAIKIADQWYENHKDIRRDKKKNTETGKEEIVERKTAPKKTACCCIAGIVSAPPLMPEESWNNYRDDTIEYLKEKYGERLKTVIEHIDEFYDSEAYKDILHHHLHFFVVANVDETIEDIHPGRKAQKEADYLRGNRKAFNEASEEERKKSTHAGSKAYKAAMTKEQDDFFESVSHKYGLSRKGPKACTHMTKQEYDQFIQDRNYIAQKTNDIRTKEKELNSREESIESKEKSFESSYKEVENLLEKGQYNENTDSKTLLNALKVVYQYLSDFRKQVKQLLDAPIDAVEQICKKARAAGKKTLREFLFPKKHQNQGKTLQNDIQNQPEKTKENNIGIER